MSLAPSEVELEIDQVARLVPGLSTWLQRAHVDVETGVEVGASGIRYLVDDGRVEISRNPSRGVALSSVAGPSLTIELPPDFNRGEIAPSGAVVYDTDDGHSSLVAEPTPDGGARIIAVVDSPSAARDYGFTVRLPSGSALRMTLENDGSVTIYSGTGNAIAKVLEPWAYDATGAPIPVEYNVNGSIITLTVRVPDSAVYPVIADPQFTWGWVSGTIYFNKVETAVVCQLGLGALQWLGISGLWYPIVAGLGSYLAFFACAARALSKCIKIKSYGVIGIYGGGYCT